MLSRVADSVYWMSRYIERAENTARVVEVTLQLMLDLPEGSTANQWEALVTATGEQPRFAQRYQEATARTVIPFLTFDRDNPNAILSCLYAARENARIVREVITNEMWEQLNTFFLMVRDAAQQEHILDSPHAFFSQVRMASHLFLGATDATMSRDAAWHFCRLGRKVERADKTTRILDVKYFLLLPDVSDVGTPLDDVQWTAILRSASALQMYRRRHGRVAPHAIVDFLLLDRQFPRSVLFCATAADASIHAITGTPLGAFRNQAERCAGQLRSELDYADVPLIIAGGLHEYLDSLQVRLNQLGAAIASSFFDPPPLQSAQSMQEGPMQ